MSTSRDLDGRAPRHRQGLPRVRTRKHYDFRPRVYALLGDLLTVDQHGKVESETAAIERLIQSAHDALLGRSE